MVNNLATYVITLVLAVGGELICAIALADNVLARSKASKIYFTVFLGLFFILAVVAGIAVGHAIVSG